MSLLMRMYPGDAWGFLVANVLVQVTAVILMAWFLAHLGSRWNAAWRHGIYLVALIGVLASPALSWVMQGTGIALVKLRSPVPTAVPAPLPIARISESDPMETLTEPKPAASRAPLEAESLGQDVQPKTTPAPSFSDILRALAAATLVIWLLGMALFLARWCYGLHLIAVLRRTAQPLSGEGIVEVLDRVRRTLGTDELPPLATSVALDRPAMVGLIRPLVILPEDLLGTLRGPELADILVHECAHAVCRHQVVGLLQRLAGILFWPHPLMHLLNRELARAREEVCDNYVLRHGNAPRYARTLLELSQSFACVSSHPTALGLFPCRWRLEDRVADLLDRRRKIMIRVNHWTTTALAASFLLLALLIACTRVIHAEPAAEEKTASPTFLTAAAVATARESKVAGDKTKSPPKVPLKLGASIPLSVESAGVTWKGNTYHLVQLASIKFNLDKSECLKADIQAGVTEFDNVNYDISAAVFDDAGQMLGSARAQCKVQRVWPGAVISTARTITLDFGVSSDYMRAATFAVSVSNRKVLTPDDWQR